MIRQIFAAATIAAAALSISAQSQPETMYLVKGDRVVGKYNVDAVDYATFRLPEGVIDENIWINVNNTGKNTVTYTVNTINPTTAFAHGLLNKWELEYWALDAFGDYFDNITEDEQVQVMQSMLMYTGYLGIGTSTVTMTNYEYDQDGAPFQVFPGQTYYVCAWEIDPNTQAPLETFAFAAAQTSAPGESQAKFDVNFVEQTANGLSFSFDCGSEIVCVQTCYGLKSVMEPYVEAFGEEQLYGMFGQVWTPDMLAYGAEGASDEYPTWPVEETDDYVLFSRAIDVNGDVVSRSVTAHGEAQASTGPQITIFSKSKSEGADGALGSVSVNFEVTPSNVSEAYVRMLDMNTCDDRLNSGYELHELAMGGDATEVTDEINKWGEYTFTNNEVDDAWKSILIYARDTDGKRTTLRLDFNTIEDAEWYEYNPVYKAGARKRAQRVKPRKPALKRVK